MRVLCVGLLSSIAFLFAAESGSRSPTKAVVAEIDGEKITRSSFEDKNQTRLFQARNSYHEAERKALDEFIDEYLLEKQAKKENLSVQALLDLHVTSKLPKDPSDEALRVYYEGIDTNESFEAVREKIVEHLRQRRAAKLKAEYLKTLRSQATIALSLDAPRAQVSLANTPVRGDRNAPVVVVEYADYECPYCQQIQPALDKLEADYKGRIAFAYKDVPLPIHANAQKAAEGAHCAGQQGKYWEYHDILARSKELQVPKLKEYARGLQLDGAAFDKCVDSGAQAAVVKAHMTEAQGLGLQGTPSFFINGRFFSGALSYEKLREIVEEELSRFGDQKTANR